MNIKQLKCGQSLFLVNEEHIDKNAMIGTGDIKTVKIIKKGSKYITVSDNKHEYIFDSLKDFKITNGYGKIKYSLYEYTEDYFKEKHKRKMYEEITKYFYYTSPRKIQQMSYEDMQKIKNIISKYER